MQIKVEKYLRRARNTLSNTHSNIHSYYAQSMWVPHFRNGCVENSVEPSLKKKNCVEPA